MSLISDFLSTLSGGGGGGSRGSLGGFMGSFFAPQGGSGGQSGGAIVQQAFAPQHATSGVHPHIQAIVNRINSQQSRTPSTWDAMRQRDPYAAQIINDFQDPKKHADFINTINSLGQDSPSGAMIQHDIISQLAPKYTGFDQHMPVMPSDVAGKGGDIGYLANELTKSTPRYGGDQARQKGSSGLGANIGTGVGALTGSTMGPLGAVGGAAAGRVLGGAAEDVVGGLFGGDSGSPDKGKARKDLQGAISQMTKDNPGMSADTAYHTLEYQLLSKGGDLSTKDAKALYQKWQTAPPASAEQTAQVMEPAIMNLEQNKIQNALDYIHMTSKQRTAAGLTSSVLSGINFPSFLPHTPETVQAWANYYAQNIVPAQINDFMKIIAPDLRATKQQFKTAKGAGQQPDFSHPVHSFLSQYFGTPANIDPGSGAPWTSDTSGGLNQDIVATP